MYKYKLFKKMQHMYVALKTRGTQVYFTYVHIQYMYIWYI